MMWLVYLAVGLSATGLSALFTPLARRLAWRFEILDKPLGEAHKRHQKSTPVLGGAAMMAAWSVVVLGGAFGLLALSEALRPAIESLGVDRGQYLLQLLEGARKGEVQTLLLVIGGGGLALGIMGLVDDRRPMGAGRKFLLQLLICGFVASYDRLQITLFWDVPLIKWAITLMWFVFILNAFNFFDNMDGLSSGVALIASLLFAVVAGIRQQDFVAALGMATAGAALGFYFYNKNPASIFMGDSGSHFLGFLLAVQGTLTHFYTEQSPTVAPVFIPLFVLALPIFDTFAVVMIRLHIGRPIWAGDHNHISHRFLKMGVSRKVAVALVHLLTLALGLSAIPLLAGDLPVVICVALQAAAILTLISVLHLMHGFDLGPEARQAAAAARESDPAAADPAPPAEDEFDDPPGPI